MNTPLKNNEMNLNGAISEWKKIQGLLVMTAEDAEINLMNTLGSKRNILGLIKPTTKNQIAGIVKIANQFKIPLYTISTGNNWGYGSFLPNVDNCMLLNLSALNKIIQFDPHLSCVTVEPGVTQQQLHDYIQLNNLPFMVPTTGAGPTCSILANALEKGYGINPHEDHFGAVLSLRAVLADGSLYKSTLYEMGGHRVDPVFKWKLGPYLEGLFAQGNFGIVTEATIALARKPEKTIQFIAFIEDEHFEEAVIALQNIKQKLGTIVGGVNLMNKRRLLAMVENHDVWNMGHVLSEMEVRKLAKKRKLPDWAMLGGIYGPEELTSGAQELIRNELRPFAGRIVFLSRWKINFLERLNNFFHIQSLSKTLRAMSEAMKILEGIPSRVALPLAYLKNRTRPPEDREPSPDRDNCGLIWFSPLLPMDASLARDFTQEVTRVCIAEGVEPLITLTGISERCFDSTIPLVFNADSDEDRARVRKCYDSLIEVAREFGIFPYRMDIESMRKYYDNQDLVSVNFIKALKQATDPNGILSPGRYSSVTDSDAK